MYFICFLLSLFLLLYLSFAQWSTKRLKFRLEWALFAPLSLGGWAKEWLHSSIQLCLYSRRVYERYVSTLYLLFHVLYCNQGCDDNRPLRANIQHSQNENSWYMCSLNYTWSEPTSPNNYYSLLACVVLSIFCYVRLTFFLFIVGVDNFQTRMVGRWRWHRCFLTP